MSFLPSFSLFLPIMLFLLRKREKKSRCQTDMHLRSLVKNHTFSFFSPDSFSLNNCSNAYQPPLSGNKLLVILLKSRKKVNHTCHSYSCLESSLMFLCVCVMKKDLWTQGKPCNMLHIWSPVFHHCLVFTTVFPALSPSLLKHLKNLLAQKCLMKSDDLQPLSGGVCPLNHLCIRARIAIAAIEPD